VIQICPNQVFRTRIMDNPQMVEKSRACQGMRRGEKMSLSRFLG
jgi:hypothetical protein